MKKTILGIFIIALSISAFGQSRARSGLSVGDHKATGTNIFVVDSITKVGGSYAIYDGADTLDPYIPVADQLNADEYFVKLLPDTISKTNAFTLSLNEADAVVLCTKASAILVTIPPESSVDIPIGTTINFVQLGAGNLVFKEGVGVTLNSKLDSIATGGAYSWAALYKRASNKWILYGDIID